MHRGIVFEPHHPWRMTWALMCCSDHNRSCSPVTLATALSLPVVVFSQALGHLTRGFHLPKSRKYVFFNSLSHDIVNRTKGFKPWSSFEFSPAIVDSFLNNRNRDFFFFSNISCFRLSRKHFSC
ncbi:unnamed protein product [Ixodes pacificus]